MFIQNARKSVESTYYQTIEKTEEEKGSFESRIKELEVFESFYFKLEFKTKQIVLKTKLVQLTEEAQNICLAKDEVIFKLEQQNFELKVSNLSNSNLILLITHF